MTPILRNVLAVTIIVALVAIVTRPRWPDSASNHGLKTAAGAYLDLIDAVATVGELFGVSRVTVTRTMLNVPLLLDRKRDTVQEYKTGMDGVEVMVYKPAGQTDDLRPGIVHYHGGGWVLLAPANYAPVIREIVEKTQSVIISVNYRKAPEHPFPIPIEDCLRATRYFLEHAKEFGVDPNRIGIKGDSAGGNLVMAATLRLAKEADPVLPRFKFMSLDYPALQAFDFELPSYKKHGHGPGFLTKEIMIKYWLAYAFGRWDDYELFNVNNHTSAELKTSTYAKYLSWEYLPKEFSEGYTRDAIHEYKLDQTFSKRITDIILDPLFAPLMASDEDLSLLPPTYIMNAEFDVLRDDGFIAAERLRRAGVEVEHSYLPAEEHGCLNLIEYDQNVVDEVINFSKWFKYFMA